MQQRTRSWHTVTRKSEGVDVFPWWNNEWEYLWRYRRVKGACLSSTISRPVMVDSREFQFARLIVTKLSVRGTLQFPSKKTFLNWKLGRQPSGTEPPAVLFYSREIFPQLSRTRGRENKLLEFLSRLFQEPAGRWGRHGRLICIVRAWLYREPIETRNQIRKFTSISSRLNFWTERDNCHGDENLHSQKGL